MKYIFWGTPEFAAIILERLMKVDFIPEAVVCNPDRPVGRKKIITSPPVKARIMNYESEIKEKIKIIQPEKLDNYLITQLLNYKADFFIIAAYSKILPKEILEIPRLGTIGVHPSLLPKYRGSSPIQTVILNGGKETGVTLYLIDEKMDSGPILATSHLPIAISDNYESLMKKLAELGADLLIETLTKFIKGEITPLPQNESEATYTKKFKTEDGYVAPEDLKAAENDSTSSLQVAIERKIRALNPEPGVYTFINGKRTKLLEAKIIEGMLKIIQIQTEGKNHRCLLK